jgi:hypothetical protein
MSITKFSIFSNFLLKRSSFSMLNGIFILVGFLLGDDSMFDGGKSTTKIFSIGTIVLFEIIFKLSAGSTFL